MNVRLIKLTKEYYFQLAEMIISYSMLDTLEMELDLLNAEKDMLLR